VNWLKVLLEFFTGGSNGGTSIVPGRPEINVPKGRRLDPDELRKRLMQLVTEPSYQPHPSAENPKTLETHCNFFVRTVAEWYGYSCFNNMVANDMYEYMKNHPDQWKLVATKGVEYDEAIEAACNGHLVIAAQNASGHGHVMVIAPEAPGERSDSWKKVVPFVANVGKTCWYGKRLSQAFIQEPDTYQYIGS